MGSSRSVVEANGSDLALFCPEGQSGPGDPIGFTSNLRGDVHEKRALAACRNVNSAPNKSRDLVALIGSQEFPRMTSVFSFFCRRKTIHFNKER